MFTWDIKKAQSNYEKHGVPLEEAVTVFLDPEGLDWEDATHSTVEPRRKRLGLSKSGRILMVVYTVRKKQDGKEAIRIISARHASRRERKAYSGQ